MAEPTVMLHVENRCTSVPRPLKQTGDPREHLFAPIEWTAKGKHA
jgi:hypothetical protein